MDDLAATGELEPEEAVAEGDLAELLSLKEGTTFMVADAWGDVRGGVGGLFGDGTRLLSRFRLLIGDKRPSRLNYGLSRDSAVFTFNGANLALPPVGGRTIPRGVIHLERKRCLGGGRLHERLRLTNFGLDRVMTPVSFDFAVDFRDIFEVRGMHRAARGRAEAPRLTGRGVCFAYVGLDGVGRDAEIVFSEPPWRLGADRADFMFSLAAGATMDLFVEIGPSERDTPSSHRFDRALREAHRSSETFKTHGAQLRASDSAFDAWLDQSRADVAALTTALPTGPYPFAGIPWFSTPFGRDGIITAWQMLWLDPSLARGVLTYLASRQADHTSAFDDSAPGKIMHETRGGEMAALKEIPFGSTTAASTPRRSSSLSPGPICIVPASVTPSASCGPRCYAPPIGWIATRTPTRMASSTTTAPRPAVFPIRAGRTAWIPCFTTMAASRLRPSPWSRCRAMLTPPGARCRRWPSALIEPGGPGWAARAETMRVAVEAKFWLEDRGFYALAIDGTGEVCAPRSSNPGHLLFVGLAGAKRAKRVAKTLMSPDFDSGWGIRTVATDASRFNPMSYHNGSIWPHDTAIAAMGMSRYGERAGPIKILCDMFAASRSFENRMPELLCGFPRDGEEPPIAYPVACMPQAWAAGSTFMMMQACLGLTIDAARKEVRLVRPTLPEGVDQLTLERLSVAGGFVDLTFQRIGGGIAVIPGPRSDPSVAVILEG